MKKEGESKKYSYNVDHMIERNELLDLGEGSEKNKGNLLCWEKVGLTGMINDQGIIQSEMNLPKYIANNKCSFAIDEPHICITQATIGAC